MPHIEQEAHEQPPSRFATRIDAGDETVLRPFLPSDAPEFHEAATESIGHVHRWLPWCHPGYTFEEAAQWVEYAGDSWGKEFNFAIADGQTGRLLGGCGLNAIQRDHRVANLGYWVRFSALRQGHCARAARALAQWGMTELHLTRIEIVAAIENIASQHVAERAGATREAVLRNRLRVDGSPQSAVIYSFVPGDVEDAATPSA